MRTPALSPIAMRAEQNTTPSFIAFEQSEGRPERPQTPGPNSEGPFSTGTGDLFRSANESLPPARWPATCTNQASLTQVAPFFEVFRVAVRESFRRHPVKPALHSIRRLTFRS